MFGTKVVVKKLNRHYVSKKLFQSVLELYRYLNKQTHLHHNCHTMHTFPDLPGMCVKKLQW